MASETVVPWRLAGADENCRDAPSKVNQTVLRLVTRKENGFMQHDYI